MDGIALGNGNIGRLLEGLSEGELLREEPVSDPETTNRCRMVISVGRKLLQCPASMAK